MRLVTFPIAILLIALAAQPGSAQTPRPERPYRGLFGGGVGETEQLLTASATVGGGYVGDILAESGAYSLTDSRRPKSSTYGQGSGSLAYSLGLSRVSLSASASTTTAYYPVLKTRFISSHGVGVGGSVQISSRTRLSGSQSLSYQPGYSLSGFAPWYDSPPNEPRLEDDFAARTEEHFANTSGIDLTHALTQRINVSANYASQKSWSQSRAYDLTAQSFGGRLGVGLAKGLALRLGYGHSKAVYSVGADEQRYEGESIEAGLDFVRPLSLTRRTTLTFSTGTTAIVNEGTSHYYLIGGARLSHEIKRTWGAGLTYSRDVRFIDTFRAPVLSDAVSAGLGGLISRRLQFSSSVGVQHGGVGLGEGDNNFLSYFGAASLTAGLTRYLAAGIDYTYYRYTFEGGVTLPPGYPSQRDRQSVRGYVRLWGPLMSRARRPNATR